jgi:hypothetical protein
VITIVSGLPRSGTSLMMQMLEAGGMPILSDGEREADVSRRARVPSASRSGVGRKLGSSSKLI